MGKAVSLDIICPLYKAEKYIQQLIADIQSQTNITIVNVIFAITESDEADSVAEYISNHNYSYFKVGAEEFSHSLTREKAIREYCKSDIVIMLSQDVRLIESDALYELAKEINEATPYAYGRQTCRKKNIEYYIRKKNYGDTSFTVGNEDVATMQLRAFFASDAFSAYYRPVFLQLNGYDEKHMMMNEDMYYAKKIIDNGYRKAYVASAVVEHSHKLTLRQLYRRYYATGQWFAQHPEFNHFHAGESGARLAFYVFGRALRDCNVPVLFRWLPDMMARYLGMKKGKKDGKKQFGMASE